MEVPIGISGIDYGLIKQYNQLSIKYNKVIQTHNKTIKDKTIENTSTDTVIRLEPPYNIPCAFLNINKCQKNAGFQLKIDSKYYCWYHMHCT